MAKLGPFKSHSTAVLIVEHPTVALRWPPLGSPSLGWRSLIETRLWGFPERLSSYLPPGTEARRHSGPQQMHRVSPDRKPLVDPASFTNLERMRLCAHWWDESARLGRLTSAWLLWSCALLFTLSSRVCLIALKVWKCQSAGVMMDIPTSHLSRAVKKNTSCSSCFCLRSGKSGGGAAVRNHLPFIPRGRAVHDGQCWRLQGGAGTRQRTTRGQIRLRPCLKGTCFQNY